MCKVSYMSRLDNDTGTLYRQTISMSIDTFEILADKIIAEIAMRYPREKEYSCTAGYAQAYLKPLNLHKMKIAYLTLTQARFINLSLKMKLKSDRNTCIIIK